MGLGDGFGDGREWRRCQSCHLRKALRDDEHVCGSCAARGVLPQGTSRSVRPSTMSGAEAVRVLDGQHDDAEQRYQRARDQAEAETERRLAYLQGLADAELRDLGLRVAFHPRRP